MKRYARRTIAAVGGVFLGWSAAGFVPGVTLSPLRAEDQAHHEIPEHITADKPIEHTQDADGHDVLGEPGAGGGHGSTADHHDAGRDAADLLVPAAEDVGWYRPVVWTIVGLFGAAVLIGVTAKKLQGPQPPDPAQDAGHDDHH